MVAGIEASDFIKFCESYGGKVEIKSSDHYICRISGNNQTVEIDLLQDGLNVKLTALKSEKGDHPEYIETRLKDPVCKIERDVTGAYNLDCTDELHTGYKVKVYRDGWFDLSAMLDKYEDGVRYPLARVILKKGLIK